MSNHDQLHRYLFKNLAVRGELVTASETYRHMLENHHYPEEIQHLLGELLVATSLLTATLKFDGEITVQLQGDGPLRLAVINGNNRQEMRGMARLQGDIAPGSNLNDMIGNGYLLITITPTDGERYQGVVSLEGENLAACLESYFMQSEQLPTRLFIRIGEIDGKPAAAGMLLQIVPAQPNSVEDLDHLAQLTATIKAEELFTLPTNDVLYRLYHQEEVILYEPQQVSFRCTCSRARCADALLTVSPEELENMLEKDGNIDMHCDFCGAHYVFDSENVQALLAGHTCKQVNNLH